MSLSVKNRTLCLALWNNKDKKKDQVEVILNDINQIHQYSEGQLQLIRNELKKHFLPYFNKCWNSSKVNRHQTQFEKLHQDWLEIELVVQLKKKNSPEKNFLRGKEVVEHDHTDSMEVVIINHDQLDDIFYDYRETEGLS